MSVKLIIDSASDLPFSFAEANNIGFAPLKTTLGGQEYRDGIDIVPEEFYEKLEANKELAHTSQVNAAEFAALFDVLVRRNIVLELNTSRLADQAARSNLQAIYCAYRDCGGRYVTLGSDAHEHQEIADNFTIAADFLQEIGLIPVHFCKRKMLIDQQKMG